MAAVRESSPLWTRTGDSGPGFSGRSPLYALIFSFAKQIREYLVPGFCEKKKKQNQLIIDQI